MSNAAARNTRRRRVALHEADAEPLIDALVVSLRQPPDSPQLSQSTHFLDLPVVFRQVRAQNFPLSARCRPRPSILLIMPFIATRECSIHLVTSHIFYRPLGIPPT